MIDLSNRITSPDDFLRLEPAELAGLILEALNSPRDVTDPQLSYQAIRYTHPQIAPPTGIQLQRRIDEAIMEAWRWLHHEGFIAPQPGQNGDNGYIFITRKGKRHPSTFDVRNYLRAKALPMEMLHPSIRDQVWNLFFRGDYDTAVFQALREVEVAVRNAGAFGPDVIGVPLMRRAFHTENGPLTDLTYPPGEREARMHLFAGAIGSYKNPGSHGHMGIESADEAAEMIVLACHLLRIVDERRNAIEQAVAVQTT